MVGFCVYYIVNQFVAILCFAYILSVTNVGKVIKRGELCLISLNLFRCFMVQSEQSFFTLVIIGIF